jgi:hypothetical protein
VITERLSFQARYGQGDALVALFLEQQANLRTPEVLSQRIYTDATGPMFTVQVEQDFADLASYTKANEATQAQYSAPWFQDWFARMTTMVERGERQLFTTRSF